MAQQAFAPGRHSRASPKGNESSNPYFFGRYVSFRKGSKVQGKKSWSINIITDGALPCHLHKDSRPDFENSNHQRLTCPFCTCRVDSVGIHISKLVTRYNQISPTAITDDVQLPFFRVLQGHGARPHLQPFWPKIWRNSAEKLGVFHGNIWRPFCKFHL